MDRKSLKNKATKDLKVARNFIADTAEVDEVRKRELLSLLDEELEIRDNQK